MAKSFRYFKKEEIWRSFKRKKVRNYFYSHLISVMKQKELPIIYDNVSVPEKAAIMTQEIFQKAKSELYTDLKVHYKVDSDFESFFSLEPSIKTLLNVSNQPLSGLDFSEYQEVEFAYPLKPHTQNAVARAMKNMIAKNDYIYFVILGHAMLVTDFVNKGDLPQVFNTAKTKEALAKNADDLDYLVALSSWGEPELRKDVAKEKISEFYPDFFNSRGNYSFFYREGHLTGFYPVEWSSNKHQIRYAYLTNEQVAYLKSAFPNHEDVFWINPIY